jgi:hypothetical protein
VGATTGATIKTVVVAEGRGVGAAPAQPRRVQFDRPGRVNARGSGGRRRVGRRPADDARRRPRGLGAGAAGGLAANLPRAGAAVPTCAGLPLPIAMPLSCAAGLRVPVDLVGCFACCMQTVVQVGLPCQLHELATVV